MDDLDMIKTAGVSTTGVAVLLLVYRLFKSIQGKRLVSSCCGRKLEVGLAVEQMTPKDIVIHNPLHQGDAPKPSVPPAATIEAAHS